MLLAEVTMELNILISRDALILINTPSVVWALYAEVSSEMSDDV